MCHLILFLPVFAFPLFWFLPFGTALPLYLFTLGICLFLYFKVFQAMRRKVCTGQEAMLGRNGVVVEDIDPEGRIQCANEIWNAATKGRSLLKGEKVRITHIKRLMLLVEGMQTDENVKSVERF
jgi:membrane-bound ClpP family serine protease